MSRGSRAANRVYMRRARGQRRSGLTGIRQHPGREQAFTVWRGGFVLGFRATFNEALELARRRSATG